VRAAPLQEAELVGGQQARGGRRARGRWEGCERGQHRRLLGHGVAVRRRQARHQVPRIAGALQWGDLSACRKVFRITSGNLRPCEGCSISACSATAPRCTSVQCATSAARGFFFSSAETGGFQSSCLLQMGDHLCTLYLHVPGGTDRVWTGVLPVAACSHA